MSGRTGRTAAVHFISQIGTSVAGFFATWFIANQLGSTILGEYTVIVAILFWLTVPSSAIATATNKRISERGDIGGYLTTGHLLNIIFLILIITVAIFAGDVINSLANDRDVVFLVILLVIAQGAFDVVLGALRGSKKVGASGVLQAVERVMRSSFQIVAIIASAGFTWLILGHFGALVIAVFLGLILQNRLPAPPSREHVRRILEYARYSWLGSLKTRAFAWTDTLVLGGFAAFGLFGFVDVTHSQIGIYEVAWSLGSVLALFGISINKTLFPEISELSADGDFEAVKHYVNEGIAFVGIFVIPGFFGSIVVGSELLSIYRAEFAQGHWILIILIASRLFSSYSKQLVSAINAIDRPDIAFRINFLFLAVNIIGNVILIALFGWYGAAVATTISAGVSMVAGTVMLSRLLGGIDIPYQEIGYQITAALVMFVLIVSLDLLLPSTTIIAIILVAIGAMVYCFALLVLSTRFRTKASSFIPV